MAPERDYHSGGSATKRLTVASHHIIRRVGILPYPWKTDPRERAPGAAQTGTTAVDRSGHDDPVTLVTSGDGASSTSKAEDHQVASAFHGALTSAIFLLANTDFYTELMGFFSGKARQHAQPILSAVIGAAIAAHRVSSDILPNNAALRRQCLQRVGGIVTPHR